MAHTKRINEAHEGGAGEREGKPKRMHKLIVASVAGASSSGGGGGGVESRGRGYRVRVCVQDACNRIHTCTRTHMRDAGKPWEKLTY